MLVVTELEKDDWNKYIINPDAISEEEKKGWFELQTIIRNLLEELKSNNRIETSYTSLEINHLKKLLKNRNYIVQIFNLMEKTTDSLEEADKFIRALREFGFNDVNYIYFLLNVAIQLTITDTETFKTLILFHLKGDFKASNFPLIMKKFAPVNWEKLEPYINNRFRNALAHGTWAMENNEIVLFDNSKLIPFEKMSLLKFLLETKKQNLMFACLSSTISENIENGFFI
jgi:hypothetical protein